MMMKMHPRNPLVLLKKPMRGTVNVPWSRKWRAVVAEFIGTAFFVYFCSGSVRIPKMMAPSIPPSAAGLLITALTQGLAALAIVASVGRISGSHINPAVSLCLAVVRSIPVLRAACYILAQLAGAIVGAALFEASVGSLAGENLGSTIPLESITRFQAFFIELMLTSMLLLTVLGTAVHSTVSESGATPLAPIPIGFAITVGVLFGGPLTGGSMNPARSFGPAVVSWTWENHWAFWAGPFLAAILVGCFYKVVFLSVPITQSEADAHHIKDIGTSHATLRGAGCLSEAELIDRTAADERFPSIDQQHMAAGMQGVLGGIIVNSRAADAYTLETNFIESYDDLQPTLHHNCDANNRPRSQASGRRPSLPKAAAVRDWLSLKL